MTNVYDILMGAGGKGAKFESIGDSVVGYIVSIDMRQRTDIKTKEPLWWDKEQTRPKMQAIITLETEQHEDDEDDGMRSVYMPIPSQMQSALAAAVRKAGAGSPEDGGKLEVKFDHEEQPTTRGFNPQKIYVVKYRAPERNAALMAAPEPSDAMPDDALPF